MTLWTSATTSSSALLLAALLISTSLLTTFTEAQINAAGTLNNDARASRFVSLLERTGQSPSDAKTLFVPTTNAFNAWRDKDPEIHTKYTSQPEFLIHLRELLEWHFVTEDSFTTDQVFDGQRGLLENSLGNITIDQRFKKIDNVALVDFEEANISTAEGMIHLVNDIIIPPYMAVNLIEHMLERDMSAMFAFSNMANLALYAELDEQIDALYEKGITFLVPPNRRFNRAEIDVPKLLTEEMKEYTKDFVLAHLIKDVYFEAGIFNFNAENNQEEFMIQSELGTSMWITTSDDRLRFQSAEVLKTDQVARNGIFHIMDYPLFPPFISDFTEFMDLSTSQDTSDCTELFTSTLLTSQEISKMENSSLTMFCPNREGFASFNNEDFQRLTEPIWIRHATEFLLNHISKPALTRAELVAQAPHEITMLNGATYELKRSGDRVRIKNTKNNQARTVFGDVVALDGYLHMVDQAITPTAVSKSIYDQSNDNPEFSLLVENIDFVQLTDLIDRDLPLTMLAPNNRAFRRVTFGTLEGGDIIKRHIFSGLLFCDVIANKTELSNVAAEVVAVELRGDPGTGPWGYHPNGGQNLWVGGAYVYTCDIFARNGILHYVDRVIGIPFDAQTIEPTTSPAPTITPQPTIYVPPSPAPIQEDTKFVPINLPPILPGVVPSVKTDDRGQEPQNSATVVGRSSIVAIMVTLATSVLMGGVIGW